MSFFDRFKQQKLLTFSLLVFTLAVGIVIGTLVNTGVHAAKGQGPAPDATPLVIPPVAKIQSQFSDLAKQVEQSVVNISTDYIPKAKTGVKGAPQEEDDEDEEDPGADLFRRFFRDNPNSPNNPHRNLPPRAFRREATGSGFIVDKNGYILTNNHVVEEADHIRVKIPTDPNEYRAKLIGVDLETDLAVIKIDPGKPLKPVKVGNSDAVQVGDWAVAIGSPFGLEATVTAGIVSATGRDIVGAQQFQHFIQTDAAINPGNSGGPLLNINGEVIGVNTAIATRSGGYQGVGFALPVNMAAAVYNSIIKTGRMSRGSIGIRFQKYENPQQVLKALGMNQGVVVEQVIPGGPSDKAGMKAEDIIVAYNGQPVKDGDDLVSRVSQTPIGTEATVTVDRAGKKVDLKVKIADREEQVAAVSPNNAPKKENGGESTDKPETNAQAKFGISIRPATEAERTGAEMGDRKGVVITQVQENSFADEIGLNERDIIVSINRQPVGGIEDVRAIQSKLKPGDPVAFRVLRPSATAGRALPKGANNYQSFYVSGTIPSGQ
jgi:serine protease Do